MEKTSLSLLRLLVDIGSEVVKPDRQAGDAAIGCSRVDGI